MIVDVGAFGAIAVEINACVDLNGLEIGGTERGLRCQGAIQGKDILLVGARGVFGDQLEAGDVGGGIAGSIGAATLCIER